MSVIAIEASAGLILTNEDPSVVVLEGTTAESLDEDPSIVTNTVGLPFERPHYLTYNEIVDEEIVK